MLTFEIGGRSAIPIRAIPFITGGCFDADQIIDLFYDPEAWSDGPSASVAYPTLSIPKAFRAEADGTVSDVKVSTWSMPREKLKRQGGTAPDSPDQLRLLFSAVFVWLDEFEVLYASLGADAPHLRTPPAGSFGWDVDAVLTKEQEQLVWEGFAPQLRKAEKPKREQRNARSTLLEGLRTEIEGIVAEARKQGIVVNKGSMPGIKLDLICILRRLKPARAGRANETYSEDFRDLGLRWVGGKNRKDREPFLACFGLNVEQVKQITRSNPKLV